VDGPLWVPGMRRLQKVSGREEAGLGGVGPIDINLRLGMR